MVGPSTPRSIEKTKQGGVKAHPLLALARPIAPKSIEKKQKRGAEVPPLLAMVDPVAFIST